MNRPNPAQSNVVRVTMAVAPNPNGECRDYQFDRSLHTNSHNYIVSANQRPSRRVLAHETPLLRSLREHLFGPDTGVASVICWPYQLHVHCSTAIPIRETNELVLAAIRAAGYEPVIANEQDMQLMEMHVALLQEAESQLRAYFEKSTREPEAGSPYGDVGDLIEHMLQSRSTASGHGRYDLGGDPFSDLGNFPQKL